MTPTRSTEDLCQDCWQDQTPDQYFPDASRYGECVRCGAVALVIRTPILTGDPARERVYARDDRFYTDASGRERHSDGTLCGGMDH